MSWKQSVIWGGNQNVLGGSLETFWSSSGLQKFLSLSVSKQCLLILRNILCSSAFQRSLQHRPWSLGVADKNTDELLSLFWTGPCGINKLPNFPCHFLLSVNGTVCKQTCFKLTAGVSYLELQPVRVLFIINGIVSSRAGDERAALALNGFCAGPAWLWGIVWDCLGPVVTMVISGALPVREQS